MAKKPSLKYRKPEIKSEKIKLNFFFNPFGTWGQFNIIGKVYAQSFSGETLSIAPEGGLQSDWYDNGELVASITSGEAFGTDNSVGFDGDADGAADAGSPDSGSTDAGSTDGGGDFSGDSSGDVGAGDSGGGDF